MSSGTGYNFVNLSGFYGNYLDIVANSEMVRKYYTKERQEYHISFAVLRAYWDAYCFENSYDYQFDGDLTLLLVDNLEFQYNERVIIDRKRKIIFGVRIKPALIKRELH